MQNSPFKYGITVSHQSFTNREVECEKLKNNLLQGVNTTIISPRRWGKSSLVEKVINEIKIENSKVKTVIIDLFSVSSEEEFLELFAKEVIKQSSSKWQDWLKSGKDIFKQLIPKLSVGIDPASDFSLSFDWGELKKYKDEVLNLPEIIGNKKGVKYIICLDEFQNLANYSEYENLEKKMRSVWQRQKQVCYCLYGSKRHMMTEIFNNPSKPFYRFGDIMLLQKIKEEKWVSFIVRSFQNTGKKISKETAQSIASLMKSHSWYTQQLAHYTWQRTEKVATNKEIEAALNELINANSPLYQQKIEIISSTQLNLLKAIRKNETQFTSSKVMRNYQLGTPRNVSKNKTILVNADVIHKTEVGYSFLDPAFELWFNKTYFNIDFFEYTE